MLYLLSRHRGSSGTCSNSHAIMRVSVSFTTRIRGTMLGRIIASFILLTDIKRYSLEETCPGSSPHMLLTIKQKEQNSEGNGKWVKPSIVGKTLHQASKSRFVLIGVGSLSIITHTHVYPQVGHKIYSYFSK
jgi:hypothetical protein